MNHKSAAAQRRGNCAICGVFYCALVIGFLASCTTRPDVIPPEPVILAVSIEAAPVSIEVPPVEVEIEIPPEGTEILPEIPEIPAEVTAMESALSRVKSNSSDIEKYFVLGEGNEIIVRAELAERRGASGETEIFEAIYNLENAESLGAGAFRVPFTISSADSSADSGELLHDTLIWNPQRDAAGILLAFDDDHKENWESYFDLFDRHNAKVTFFVQGEYCSFSNTALERGHDVGYHTWNHLQLRNVNREVFVQETVSRTPVFRAAGVPLESFAYPYGLSDDWMHEELLKHFRILRGYGVTFRVYDSNKIREGYISSRALDNTLFREDAAFVKAVDAMLRTLKFIGGDLVLPVTTHVINDNADWGIKPHRLEYFLESVNNLQLNFYLYRDFFDS